MTVQEPGADYRKRIATIEPPEEPQVTYRPLTAAERQDLEARGNVCDDWTLLRVAEGFRPEAVRNCRFSGRVNLGVFDDVVLSAEGVSHPAGLRDSVIAASTVAGNSAVAEAAFISHCYIGRGVLLHRVQELLCTPAPSFGLADPRAQNPPAIEAVNENGSRSLMLHPEALSADCALQLLAAGDSALQQSLQEFTRRAAEEARSPGGPVSIVGDGCCLLSAGRLRNVRIGPGATLRGPTLIEDVTVRSSAEHPTVLGEAVQLQRGLVGYGCLVRSAAIAADFLLGDGTTLELGARLLHTILGENSAVGCAEVQHAMLAPFHAQHHNNSFLIAARLGGQSNIAAGATLGSNHNSRSADGELRAGRGFWPALCSSVKHNSVFASYTLLAKGAYPAELHIPLPFSLVSREEETGRLLVVPAFWPMYNLYALARNAAKFPDRDKRPDGAHLIESNFLAPDTAEELLEGIELLDQWIGRESLLAGTEEQLLQAGTLERSRRQPKLLKAASGYLWYRRLLQLYGIAALERWWSAAGTQPPEVPASETPAGEHGWRDLAGLPVAPEEWSRLRADIAEGRLASWSEVHRRYAEIGRRYPEHSAAHGYAMLLRLYGGTAESPERLPWRQWTRDAAETLRKMIDLAEKSRRKDFSDPFRHITFGSEAEAREVYGTLEEDPFLHRYASRCRQLADRLASLGG